LFREELYDIEAGRHLSFGYVDFPPSIALVARVLDVAHASWDNASFDL